MCNQPVKGEGEQCELIRERRDFGYEIGDKAARRAMKFEEGTS